MEVRNSCAQMEKFVRVSCAGPCTCTLGRTRIVFEGIVYRLIQIGRAATAADGDGEWLRLRGTAERLRRRLGMTLERCGTGARASGASPRVREAFILCPGAL